ncbi:MULTISPECIES: ATP-binding protein [Kocuria]|uniref:ATP-binding protein n=1 Tax=Kocuria subflava TaxID=1736139 RepID=A0A846U995_9MICC|nr:MULTISPECIES: AAA family ATPase [Kocuria]NKE10116.1 ATP-binding protein [Kocuria subflava]
MDETAGSYPRHALSLVQEALGDTPVVVLQGARQVGKSTLAQMASTDRETTVVSLDDPYSRSLATEDPQFFVERAGQGMLVVDEAQRAPDLILPIKASVDRQRRPGRFLLTGSADLLHVKGVGDSLAGRAETVELMTLSQGEISRRSSPEDFVSWVLEGAQSDDAFLPLDPQTVVSGGYPEVLTRSGRRRDRWFASYTARLADHDARDLQSGGFADHMAAVLRLLAAQGQSELVKAKEARTLGISETTLDSYLRLAQVMRLVTTTAPWRRTPRSRLSKRPKVSLTDTGLTAHLAGFTAPMAATIGGREFYGTLVEQFVALELQRQRTWSEQLFELYHYRDHDGPEVDLLLELSDGRLIAIEVKSARTVNDRSWAGLKQFRDHVPDREVVGVVLHTGTEVAHLHDWLHVLPISSLWGHPTF